MTHTSAVVIKSRNSEKGFTLLEVIIAISILTIGLLAVASMQVSAIKGNTLAFGVTEATSWAGDQIEKLIVLPYDHANLVDTDGDGTDEDPDGDGIDNDGGNFGLEHATATTADHHLTWGKHTVYWNIAVDADAGETKTVSVIVTWTDHGIQKNVSVRCIIPDIS